MGIRYEELPISLITFQNKTFVFNDLLHKHTLSLLQIEIYLKLINSIYFVDGFNLGEKIIKDKLFFLRSLNITLTWIFIVLIIILNCVIAYLNNRNIHITYELYCQMLFISFMKLEEEETKSNLNFKLESLITISQVYSKIEDKNYTMKHFYIHSRHLFCNNIFSSILNITVTIIYT